MEPLHIPASHNTPAISYKPEHAWFRVVGNSIPENASTFYAPVVAWLKTYVNELPDGCSFEFSLPYFNSSTLKALYTVLMEIKLAMAKGKRFSVTWYVEEDDDFMQEAGETYQEMLGMKISIIPGHIEI
ncbi:MAG: DUF1987 domain-containing protein [Flavobacteriales bacterium]|nr:DUF1987 domain-containing protein [Flavobacteriales bacterium]